MIDKHKNFYNLEELEILAKNLIKELKKGSIVCLKGELGAGKTTFARFIINSLYDSKKIKKPTSIQSPSFPILLTYDLSDVEIFHYDLYRIKTNSELDQFILNDGGKTTPIQITVGEYATSGTYKVLLGLYDDEVTISQFINVKIIDPEY